MTKDKLRVRGLREVQLVSLHLVKSDSIAAVSEKEMFDSLPIFRLSACLCGCVSACLSMYLIVSVSIPLSVYLCQVVCLSPISHICLQQERL